VRIASIVSLGAAFLFISRTSPAQPVEVTHLNGLVTIQCKDAPLASVFERIEEATGIELTLEDEVKSKRLSANLAGLPVSMAVSRLLEGAGVNYIVMMDPLDWGRVDKIFVGAGGGGPARAAGPVRGPVPAEPVDEAFEEAPPESFEEGMDPGDMGDAVDPGLEAPEDTQSPDEDGAGQDQGDFAAPPGSSPLPDFLPPTRSYPRSSFTPGLPGGNQRTQGSQGGMNQQPQPQEQDPANTPPATLPFSDPFGRPIPIPPGMNQQQQQNRRQQQQKQKQQ
jgi:hypothetical protein